MSEAKANSPGPDMVGTCEYCDGYGWYCDDNDFGEEEEYECEPCRGTGYARHPSPHVLDKCRTCNGTGAPRPRSEVLAARRTIGGCCDRYADNMACDCLTERHCGACEGTGRKPT